MNATSLAIHLQSKATHVANSLNALTPYERALVLHHAEIIWAERRRWQPDSTEADETVVVGQWVTNVVQRLSPDDRERLVDVVTRLDEEGRLERMVGETDFK